VSEKYQVSSSPHVRAKDSTSRVMLYVIIALLPATLFGIWNFGMHALLLILVTIASCLASEWIFDKIVHKKNSLPDLSAVVTGLLLALNLPAGLPWWEAVIGSVFAIVIVKMMFGGLGQNFMNPALGGRCFLLIAFAADMTNFKSSKFEAYSGATPLAMIRNEGLSSVNVMDMLTGKIPGTIGETSVIAILIGAIILILLGVITLRIPAAYLITFAVFMLIFGKEPMNANYLVAELCGGGLMLGAFFMATDYVTSPITPAGQIIYGICCGLLTGIFRCFGANAEGVSFAIILSNILVPIIEKFTIPRAFGLAKEAKNKQIIHDALVLTAFTLVIGVILGAVYGITKAPIDKANEQTKKEAYQAVFADASGFNQQEYDADAADKMVADAGYDDTIDDVEQAVDKDGNALGYVITVTAKDGSQGSITFSVGIKNDGTVNGYSITDISETPGLGMKAEEEDFYSQFENKTVDKFTVVKQKPASDDQIEAITGSTITSKAMANGCNAAIYYFQNALGGAQ